MEELNFKGTTAECLEDLFRRYQWESVRPFVAEFVRVDEGSVRRWRNGQMPVGGPLLYTRVLLDLLGYEVEEFASEAEPIKQFAKAIVLRLITVEEAVDMLGYRDIGSLYKLLLRNGVPLQAKAYRLERFVQKSEDDLETAISDFRKTLVRVSLEIGFAPVSEHTSSDPSPPMPPVPTALPTPPVIPVEPEPPTSSDSVVTGLAYSLLAADALSRAILTGDNPERQVQALYTIIDRSDLREIVDQLEGLLAANPAKTN